MKAKPIQAAALVIAVSLGPIAQGHHSIGMFDISAPAWVKATVVRYEPRNPHVMLELEEKAADGHVRSWTIEGPIMPRLGRMNLARDFIKPGDVVEVCGFPYRQEILANREAMPTGTASLPHLHGMLLVLPDGRKQPWGAYGKLDNCVRSKDTASMWVEFIDAVPMAREYWCKGLQYPNATRSPKALVDEVNRSMQSPCE